jgi:hypothetical protein
VSADEHTNQSCKVWGSFKSFNRFFAVDLGGKSFVVVFDGLDSWWRLEFKVTLRSDLEFRLTWSWVYVTMADKNSKSRWTSWQKVEVTLRIRCKWLWDWRVKSFWSWQASEATKTWVFFLSRTDFWISGWKIPQIRFKKFIVSPVFPQIPLTIYLFLHVFLKLNLSKPHQVTPTFTTNQLKLHQPLPSHLLKSHLHSPRNLDPNFRCQNVSIYSTSLQLPHH